MTSNSHSLSFNLKASQLEDFIINYYQVVRSSSSAIDYIIVSLLWYNYHCEDMENGMKINEIKEFLRKIGLINYDDYRNNKIDQIINQNEGKLWSYDPTKQRYSIKLIDKYNLNKTFSSYIDVKPTIKIPEYLIKQLTINDNSPLNRVLPQLINEANQTYAAELFNSCSLLCRRILEIILIRALIDQGSEQDIIDNNSNGDRYQRFSVLINKAKNRNYMALHKKTKACLEIVKDVGNLAAHSDYRCVDKKQIDKFKDDIHHTVLDILDQTTIQYSEQET